MLIAHEITFRRPYWMYHPKQKSFTVERAEIEHRGYSDEMLGYAWHDQQARGFILVSPKTNNKILFCFQGTIRSADGEDIAAWEYHAHSLVVDGQERPLPDKYKALTVSLIND